MQVALINPYFGEGANWETSGAVHSPPLNLGFIATYLRDHGGVTCRVIDPFPQGMSVEDVLKVIVDYGVIGLACYTDTRHYCFNFAKRVKELYPDKFLVVGGPHCFSLDQLILKHYPFVDAVIRGEGEQSLLDLVQGTDPATIHGLTWRKDGNIIQNQKRPLLADIDSLYVDYDLLPDMSYYGGDNEAPASLRNLRQVYFISSRGCPFQCIYCANDHWERSWRPMSPATLVGHIERIVKKYNVEYFRFYDDLFTVNKKWVMQFCDLLEQKALKVRFRVLIRGDTKPEVIQRLCQVGLVAVGLGVESGSDRMLKAIAKGITSKQLIETMTECKRLGLWLVGSFILSLPDETPADFEASKKLMAYPDVFQAPIMTIFPGTPLYTQLKNTGEINDEIWFNPAQQGRILYCKENFPSARYSREELAGLQLYIYNYKNLISPLALFRLYGPARGLLNLVKSALDFVAQGRVSKAIDQNPRLKRKILNLLRLKKV